MAIDTAQRLLRATEEQQVAFLKKLHQLLADNDLDEANSGEGSELDSFVDGLFAVSPPQSGPGACRPGERNSHSDGLVRDFLCKAMTDGKLTDRELDGLRTLLGKSDSQQVHRPNTPGTNQVRAAPRVDYSRTEDQRSDAAMNWLVRIGAVSKEVGEGAKAILRSS